MRLLILGGTLFLGRHVVEAGRARGHELTLFNRGRTDPAPVPGVGQIHGDRERDLSLLGGREWDAVIDTSGYLPRVVRASAELLAGAVDRYLFVSSISAYGTFPRAGLDESAPTAPAPPSDAGADADDVTRYYAELKAACEREVESVLAGRALVVRPGLIIGPHDPTGRFTYWVRRLAEGGRVLAPRAPDQPVQLIDARDLAGWMLDLVESGATGVYNATGPAAPLTLGPMLERIRTATGGRAELAWVDEDRLAEAGVQPWVELPLWLDLPRHEDFRGFLAVEVSRALGAGLSLRALEETVADTLAWLREDADPRERAEGDADPRKRADGDADPAKRAEGVTPPRPAGLTREREAELLERLAV